MKTFHTVKLPGGYLHSIEGRDIRHTVNIHGAELFRSIHAARATVRFILPLLPAFERFKVYPFPVSANRLK